MTTEEDYFVSNHLIQFLFYYNKFPNCKNFSEITIASEGANKCITLLKENNFPKTFNKTLSKFITNCYSQRHNFDSYLFERLKEKPSIATFRTETKYAINKSIPNCIIELTELISNESLSPLPKRSTINLIELSISQCIKLKALCNEHNSKLISEFKSWLIQQRKEIENKFKK